MEDWLLRHPAVLGLIGAAMALGAIALEIGDLVSLRGGARVVGALTFVAAAVVSFIGFQSAWQRRARAGTLVLDRQKQADQTRQALGPGLIIAAILTIVVSIVGPGLESAIFGMAVGLLSSALVARRRLKRLQN